MDKKRNQGITYQIIGAAMRVHNRLTPGLKEVHYQRALTAELRATGLKVSEEHQIEVYDGERWLGRLYLDQLEYRRVLPPKQLTGWQERIGRYLWKPVNSSPNTHPR